MRRRLFAYFTYRCDRTCGNRTTLSLNSLWNLRLFSNSPAKIDIYFEQFWLVDEREWDLLKRVRIYLTFSCCIELYSAGHKLTLARPCLDKPRLGFSSVNVAKCRVKGATPYGAISTKQKQMPIYQNDSGVILKVLFRKFVLRQDCDEFFGYWFCKLATLLWTKRMLDYLFWHAVHIQNVNKLVYLRYGIYITSTINNLSTQKFWN